MKKTMERIKLFSKEEPRIKLFSKERIKLFSGVSGKVLSCSDCGYKLKEGEAGWTTNQVCPKCGGTRFNVDKAPEKIRPEENIEEKNFQKEFSSTDSEFEIKLREFSGHNLTGDEVQKEFGITGDDLVDRGYSDYQESNNTYFIHQDAFLQSRLFSNLRISITKTLELDPSVVCGKPEDGIARLEEISDLCPKSIMILKKAHGIDTNSWLSDSGILGDLKLEMGGSSKPIPEFKKIIEERYPDAPEGIMEILEKNGVIKPSGENTIEIIK